MKKATKAAALVLTVVMMAASLTACGKSAEPGEVKDTTAAAQNENANAAGEQEEADTENAAPAAGGTLIFGTNAEFPPFEYVTSSGVIDQYDGIDMAIAKNIAEANGMTAKVENMEFESLLIALQNGQIMIVKEDSDIASAADLAEKKICVIQGYTGEICVKDMGYPYEAFKKGTDAIMELINGKCDVVVLDSATAQKYVSDNEGLKIVEDAAAFESEEYAIAVKKGNTELLDKINTVIDTMLADGTVAELGAQYIEAISAE